MKASQIFLNRLLFPGGADYSGQLYMLQYTGTNDEQDMLDVNNIADAQTAAITTTRLNTYNFQVIAILPCQFRHRGGFINFGATTANASKAGTFTHFLANASGLTTVYRWLAGDVGNLSSDAVIRLPQVTFALNEVVPSFSFRVNIPA